MRRRKRAYVLKYPRASSSGANQFSSHSSLAPDPSLFTQSNKSIYRRRKGTRKLTTKPTVITHSESFKKKPKRLRERLRQITALSAVLGWTATIIGYLELQGEGEADGLRGAICLISVVQVVLLFLYASTLLNYSEYLRVALLSSPVPTPSLLRSPWILASCLIEAAFHLLVTPLKAEFRRTEANLTLNDLFFIFLLLRNYHTVRFIYWMSRFSAPRVHVLASIAYIKPTAWSTVRTYIAAYSLKLVLIVYSAFMVISGLVLYVLERNSHYSQFGYPQNGLWVVAVTQTAIGYGDVVPDTYLGQLSIAVSCFLGSSLVALITSSTSGRLALSRAECGLYSELAYMRYRRKYQKPAIILIQRWWRFMAMRLRRRRNGVTIVDFYSQLRVHRRVLATANAQKDRSFDLQLSTFHLSTCKQLRSLHEYLSPVSQATPLVLPTQTIDILRNEYQIKSTIKSISRFAHKHKPRRRSSDAMSVSSLPSPSPTTEPSVYRLMLKSRQSILTPRSEGTGLARAKIMAHQKVIERLAKQGSDGPREVLSPMSAFV